MDRLATPGACENWGPLGERPVLSIALESTRDLDERGARRLAAALAALPAPTVAVVTESITDGASPATGIEELAAAFDLRVSDESELEAVEQGVRAHPLAALALVQVLRAHAWERGDEQALTLESFAYGTLQEGPEHLAWLAQRGPAQPPTKDDTAPVLTARHGERLDVVLNRPHRRNAFSVSLRDGLCEALAIAEADATIRELCLSGAGPCFSSGGDLLEFGTRTDPATAHAVRSVRSPARSLARLASRVHARVHGACHGAGVELPAFAARVVADPQTSFELPELGLGLIPGAGGTVSLPRRIGPQRTAWMALTGRPVDATTALAWGLVDDIQEFSQ